MSITITKTFYHTLLAGVLLLTAACSKSKEDVRTGNEPDYSNSAKSSVRLLTFNTWDLMVNGTKVTNWFFAPSNSPLAGVPFPTPYFPTTGKLKDSWYLPQQFLDSKGEATIKVGLAQGGSQASYLVDSFTVKDDYYQPSDYYLYTSAVDHLGAYSATRVPRTTAIPADPTHIRIRLVNLCAAGGNGGDKGLTLALADGTPVSGVTSHIVNHTWSDYVELPSGTYQFKVLIDGAGLQIPGKPPALIGTISQDNYSLNGTQVYYCPVQTFQPGGVYTVVVARMSGIYQYNEYPLFPNTFSIITDIDPPVNIAYGRIQLVNAAVEGEKGIHMQIDGHDAPAVAYGKAGDYVTLVTGAHAIRITDASGKSLVEKNIQVNGGDNLTVWAYPANSGTALTVVTNNMGGTRIGGTNSDGSDALNNSYNPLKFKMLVQTRFLNLCPELPEVTFTGVNGALFKEGMFSSAAAAQHLLPGQPPSPVSVPYPYVDLGTVTGGAVQVYRSQPGVLPGDRITGVPALTKADFVKMPATFFPDGNSGAEAGVYTVALVGHNTAGEHPRLIVIKHNQ
ncbi:DUF4397 domain-containing protein [Chitinophaga eiseniae]|uniref:DUF4397 domain-containing protein n=1 Tax=Chitinophaga eiseniae TaxID=634771 RepID=A0A847SQZ2_9BACT|nr:DUF4397 domain-containing protein [Chitinophaga eiseniae]NLR82493.1 DUF4397 domain-containing protein [Chitinophaga eiseniae]